MPVAEDPVVTMLREELADRTQRSDDEAWAMPAQFYTSPDFLALEEDHLLRREWLCVGHVDEIRNPGDFYTTDLLGELLIVLRNQDGTVRVLSNVCRHRGNQIAQGSGNQRKFVCPYHTWTYGLDGDLLAAPFMKKAKAFDQSKCSLPEFRTEIWNNWLFVNLDGKAAPLAPRLGGIQKIIDNYHHEDRYLVFHEEDVWNTNWKCLTENFLEGYHLSSTHLTTLHPITPTRLCKKMPFGEAFTGYHSYYDPQYPPRGPFHDDMTQDERTNSPMFGVYPNLVVGMATNFTLFMCVRPLGVDKVGIRWGVAGLKDDPNDEAVAKYVQLCRDFNIEDREKLETLQDALNTKTYHGGPLAPADFEGTIWDFIRYVGSRLGADVTLES